MMNAIAYNIVNIENLNTRANHAKWSCNQPRKTCFFSEKENSCICGYTVTRRRNYLNTHIMFVYIFMICIHDSFFISLPLNIYTNQHLNSLLEIFCRTWNPFIGLLFWWRSFVFRLHNIKIYVTILPQIFYVD